MTKPAQALSKQNVPLGGNSRRALQSRLLTVVYTLVDAATLAASYFVLVSFFADTNQGRATELTVRQQAAEAVLIVAICMAVIAMLGGYQSRNWNTADRQVAKLLKAFLISAGVSAFLLVLLGVEVQPQGFISFFGLALIGTTLARLLVRRVASSALKELYTHKVLAVGSPSYVNDLLDRIERSNSRTEVAGVLVTNRTDELIYRRPVLGLISEVKPIAREYEVDTILVASGSHSIADINEMSWELAGTEAKVILASPSANVTQPRVELRNIFGIPLVELRTPGLTLRQARVKRLVDLSLASILLVPALPVMALVATAIYAEDRGPLIFRQLRVGQDGRDFVCLKFRSMYRDAQEREKELRDLHLEPGKMWKVEADPRVTRVGNFIRRTSLDELPQLFNVFNGTMSLVGPRPKQRWETLQYSDQQLRRHTVKPGVTGLSQVLGRSDLSIDEAGRLDLEYVENWTLAKDLAIALKTLKVVVARSGSY